MLSQLFSLNLNFCFFTNLNVNVNTKKCTLQCVTVKIPKLWQSINFRNSGVDTPVEQIV